MNEALASDKEALYSPMSSFLGTESAILSKNLVCFHGKLILETIIWVSHLYYLSNPIGDAIVSRSFQWTEGGTINFINSYLYLIYGNTYLLHNLQCININSGVYHLSNSFGGKLFKETVTLKTLKSLNTICPLIKFQKMIWISVVWALFEGCIFFLENWLYLISK